MIGRTIAHYEIVDHLGSGGMGVVYKAEDTQLKRTVALKFLPPDLTRDEEARERFMREAQAASALDHANICTIHQIDETDDGQLFIAMGYYEGQTLKDRLADGPLPLDRCMDVAVQLANGLACAHEAGIIHRDIKPANVMVTDRGEVKILDFGVAKLTDAVDVTREGRTVGTAAYMSPEQARGDEVDHRTDLWALGVILYEVLTGERPFRGDYEAAVVYSILNTDPESPTVQRPEVTAALVNVVETLLQKEPDARYQRAADVVAALDGLRHGTAAPVNTTAAEPMPKRRRSLLYAALVALVLVSGALSIFWPRGAVPPAQHEASNAPSIAVLPFANRSADPEQEYFGDGLAEELMYALSKIEGLRVAAQSSSFYFKGKNEDVRTIGEQLGVGMVLGGSVRKEGNTLRVTAELTNAADGFRLWSNRYERELDDVFAIQDEITESITEALQIEIQGEEVAQLTQQGTESTVAYTLYLQGRYHFQRRTPDDLTKAIAYFGQAIAEDPDYARAYAGLAAAYNMSGNWSYLAPEEAFPRARAEVQKALALDEQLAEAYVALGFLHFNYDWDWSAVEEAYVRALAIDPDYVGAYYHYGLYLATVGRFDEGLAAVQRAQALDPLNLYITTGLGWILCQAGRNGEAISELEKSLDMDPYDPVTHYILGDVYLTNGQYEQAIASFQRAGSITETPLVVAELGQAYALSGRPDEALRMLERLNELAAQRYVSPAYYAFIFAGLGEKDQAFAWLDKAYEGRAIDMAYLKTWKIFDPLRDDPRFTVLLEKMGFEDRV